MIRGQISPHIKNNPLPVITIIRSTATAVVSSQQQLADNKVVDCFAKWTRLDCGPVSNPEIQQRGRDGVAGVTQRPGQLLGACSETHPPGRKNISK